MAYLLDTNVWIDLFRGVSPQVASRMREISADEIRLSAVVLGELAVGAKKAGDKSGSSSQMRLVADLSKSFALLNVDQATAQAYADIRHELESAGQIIGANDLWIAAQAVAQDLILVTSNESEFRRVPELKVENWRTSGD